ncbi:hypothetical protein OB894_01375 [Bacillus subtilis]|uniref:hypothetical protein n=1 Tax=Bacillus subtilis TaxID=1423 RepID=UPI003528ABDC
MAKLNGVKTLDMVNGEITKVSYGEAIYERVEGEAKVGDIALANKPGLDTTEGAYYEVEETRRDSFVYLDDTNEHHVWDYDGMFAIFRKVAANTNPSVEERIAKVEGEIESLKSDVAALKGEAEYKRIAKSEARAGDYVKFDDPPSYLTDKEYYEIKEFDDGDPVIIDDDNDEYDTYIDNFEVYRKVSASSVETEPKPERLKVGDYAKVVGNSNGFSETGSIVKITVDDGSECPFKITFLNGEYAGWDREESLVRATDEEVAEAKDAAARAKFKRGDKVRLKSGGEKFPLSGFSDGGVYTVMYNDFNHSHGKRIRIADGTEGFGYATPDQLEILSEEEAAEHKKWAEIGREVGEYKVGDVVRYDHGDNEICEVVDDTEDGRVGVQTKDYGICREKPDTLRLITPVEARFDR